MRRYLDQLDAPDPVLELAGVSGFAAAPVPRVLAALDPVLADDQEVVAAVLAHSQTAQPAGPV
jgi:hypothetical protein